MTRLPGPATSPRDNTRGNGSVEAETPLDHTVLPDAMFGTPLRELLTDHNVGKTGFEQMECAEELLRAEQPLRAGTALRRYFHCCFTSSHSARRAVTASWGSRTDMTRERSGISA